MLLGPQRGHATGSFNITGMIRVMIIMAHDAIVERRLGAAGAARGDTGRRRLGPGAWWGASASGPPGQVSLSVLWSRSP